MIDRFIRGVQFYRFPGPDISELRKDLKLYKKWGFNAIRLQQSWNADEPEEGKVEPRKILEILELAREEKMSVLITFSLELAPAWLYEKFPDAFMVNAWGEPCIEKNPYVLPGDGKPGPCWDHQGFVRAAESFIKRFNPESWS